MAATDERYHVIPYADAVNRTTLILASDCGTIHVASSISGEQAQSTFFRPESPIYNVQNSAVGGHVLLRLAENEGLADVAVVTFTNNSTNQGNVSLKVALNFTVSKNQERLHFADTIQSGESVTVHVVFNRP